MGHMEAPSSWKIERLVFFRKPDADPKKGIRSYTAIALTSVMSKWYASRIILLLEQRREPQNWKKLHVGGIHGIWCFSVSPCFWAARIRSLGCLRELTDFSILIFRKTCICVVHASWLDCLLFFGPFCERKKDRLALLLRTSLSHHQV